MSLTIFDDCKLLIKNNNYSLFRVTFFLKSKDFGGFQKLKNNKIYFWTIKYNISFGVFPTSVIKAKAEQNFCNSYWIYNPKEQVPKIVLFLQN